MRGRVQGVGFRWFVQRVARGCQVGGDVCNLPDGRVEIRAIGTSSQLAQLLDRVRQGPPAARVEDVETLEPQDDLEPDDFQVRF